jgi:hypothetical protein
MSTALPLAPRIPEGPHGKFTCEHFRCVMAGRFCVTKQTEREWVAACGEYRVPFRNQFCASGDCVQGKEIAAALAGKPLQVRTGEDIRQANKAAATERGLATVARIEGRLAAAQETDMEKKRTCSKDGCKNALGAANKSGICSACSSGYQPRTAGQAKTANTLARAAHAAKAALQPPAVPSAPPTAGEQPGTVRAVMAPAAALLPEVPIEELIRSRLEHHRARVAELLHHQTEAAKLERALAALLEVNPL